MKLSDIFWVFFKIGVILFGGGYVILPILKSELVSKKQCISADDLTEIFALCQSLPGIISVNIAVFIGNKCKGFLGAVTALIAIIIAPFITITIIASGLYFFYNSHLVQSALNGIIVGIIILLIISVTEIWQHSVINKSAFLIFLTVLVLMSLYPKLSPAWVVSAALVLGIVRGRFVTQNKKEICK